MEKTNIPISIDMIVALQAVADAIRTINNAGYAGTQTAATIIDFNTAVSANADVLAALAHILNVANPHGVTKLQLGLGNVDDTADLAKPISTATQTALDGKADTGDVITDHGGLTGLTDDDHTQYLKLLGRAGGQVVYGGDAANDDITIESTSHVTKTSSYLVLQPNGGKTGIGVAVPLSLFHIEGTDAILRIRDTDSPSTDYAEMYHSSNVGLVFTDRNAASTSTIRFSPIPTNGTAQATVEFFRSTNTTGIKRFLFKKGDNTNTNQHWISIGAATEFNLLLTSTDDFVIHGTSSNLFFADVSTNRVGLGTATPTERLQVVGNIAVSGTVDGRDVSADGARLDTLHGATGSFTTVDGKTVTVTDGLITAIV